MTVRSLLETHGLGHHASAFERNFVQLGDLGELTDEDLVQSFGIASFIERKRFKAAVASLATAASAVPTSPSPWAAPPTSLADGATRVDGMARATSGPASLPDRLGSYRVVGTLGAGGMGTVVRARHVEEAWALQQGGDVAIKLIHPAFAEDPSFRNRFLSEAALGRRVQHPGLVPTWDVIVEGPWLATVMSYVPGSSLASRVRPGGAPLAEVLALLGPIGAALDALHAQGIVHRDLKPGNVVVRPDGAPVVLDLGIAKDLRADRQHTRTLAAIGTTAWMSPEQADALPVDGATDRYALGLLAYALLAGKMPWPEDSTEARVLARKLTGQLDPLEGAAPSLPAHVTAAVLRMVALRPEDRFPTCAAFVEALADDGAVKRRREAEAARKDAREAAEQARKETEARAQREATAEQARKEAAAHAQREAATEQARKEAAARTQREAADRQARKHAEARARREEGEARARKQREAAAQPQSGGSFASFANREADIVGDTVHETDTPDETDTLDGVLHTLSDTLAWVTSPTWPRDAMKEAYAAGKLIVDASWSAPLARWLVVFTQHRAGQTQRWSPTPDALSSTIAELGDNGANLRIVPADNGRWLAIGSGEGLLSGFDEAESRHLILSSDALPERALRTLNHANFRITSVHAEGDRWAITARKSAGRVKQAWTHGGFADVAAFITAQRDAGLRLVSLGYGGDQHFVVVQDGHGTGDDWHHAVPAILAARFTEIHTAGTHVIAVHADDDGWLLVACTRPPWTG